MDAVFSGLEENRETEGMQEILDALSEFGENE